MLRQLFLCLLLISFVSGQTAQPAPAAPPAQPGAPAAAKAPDSSAPEPPKIGPDDTVLTIKGYCPNTTLEGDACKTTITKAQFEKLADALQPNMSPPMRRQLASAYARMLAMSSAAEKRDLEKSAHFEEAMRFARMQILSQELSKTLQSESNNVSDPDIQDYYNKNLANYEQATLIRLFIPHTKRVETPVPPAKKPAAAASKAAPTDKDKDADDKSEKTKSASKSAKTLSPEEQEKAGEEAMKKEAARLRTRLIAGDDPDKLEKAAFTAGGLPGTPPTPKMEKVRRTSLPPAHQSVMDLKPGDVSEVISDPSGNYVYKMISKDTLPLDQVKTEIKSQLSAQRYRDSMKIYQNNADLNDAFFGPTRGPGMPGMPPQRGPAKPGAKDKDKDEDRD